MTGSNCGHGLRRRNGTGKSQTLLFRHPHSSSMGNMEKSKYPQILPTSIKEQDRENVVCAHGNDLRVV